LIKRPVAEITDPVRGVKASFKMGLKGQCHEIFDFWFFHESVSPTDTGGKFATGVVDTGGEP
jgi:hypothetical protein